MEDVLRHLTIVEVVGGVSHAAVRAMAGIPPPVARSNHNHREATRRASYSPYTWPAFGTVSLHKAKWYCLTPTRRSRL